MPKSRLSGRSTAFRDLRYRPRALADIDTILGYLNPRSPSGAINVLRSIVESIQFISEFPLSSPRSSISGIYMRVVPRYGYKIFYRVQEDAVVIVHIRHPARRP